jgi:hypothetical protein
MSSTIIRTARTCRWPLWLGLAVFLLLAGFTAFKSVDAARDVMYWRLHRDEPIRGWMTVGYVAHAYRVPPHVLYLALDLPYAPPNRRPLRDIAKRQHRSMDQIRAILQNAVVHARPPYPPPSPRSEGRAP